MALARTDDWVTFARRAWAVLHTPTRYIAVALCLSKSTVHRAVQSGRPDVPAELWAPDLAAIPWPPDALARVIDDIRHGRRPGPPAARRLDDRRVRQAREMVARGLSTRAVAAAVGCSQPVVSEVVNRRAHAHVRTSPAELQALAERGLVELPEYRGDRHQGTGRIIAPDGSVWPDVHHAELATGTDRMAIAKALVTPGSGWQYEQGEPSPVPIAVYGSTLDRRGGGYRTYKFRRFPCE